MMAVISTYDKHHSLIACVKLFLIMPEHTYEDQYTLHNRIKLIHGGKEYFHLLSDLIDNSKNSIHLQMYIFSDDCTGQTVADHLMAASQRGVAVYMLVDGYASQSLSKIYFKFKRSRYSFPVF